MAEQGALYVGWSIDLPRRGRDLKPGGEVAFQATPRAVAANLDLDLDQDR